MIESYLYKEGFKISSIMVSLCYTHSFAKPTVTPVLQAVLQLSAFTALPIYYIYFFNKSNYY